MHQGNKISKLRIIQQHLSTKWPRFLSSVQQSKFSPGYINAKIVTKYRLWRLQEESIKLNNRIIPKLVKFLFIVQCHQQ